MNFARPVSSKSSSTSMVIPPLPALAKVPSRLQPKRYKYFSFSLILLFSLLISPSLLPTAIKKDVKVQEIKTNSQLFSCPNENDLNEIVK